MSEQLAVIRCPEIGAGEYGGVALRFETYIEEHVAASQVLSLDEARPVLAQVRDVKLLDGMPCWVEVNGNRITFVRLWTS